MPHFSNTTLGLRYRRYNGMIVALPQRHIQNNQEASTLMVGKNGMVVSAAPKLQTNIRFRFFYCQKSFASSFDLWATASENRA
jgi:hypothetical protein